MSKVFVSVKLFGIWLYNALLSPTSQMIAKSNPDRPPEEMLYFFTVMMFVPEVVLIFSKGFRGWIQQGVENADGVLNKSDLKDMVILYGSLWCLRVFLFMSWSKIIYGTNIEFYIYMTPLLGSFGISGLPILKSFIGKK